MLFKNVSKMLIVMAMAMFIMLGISTNAMGVELADGVETGMSISEVSQKLDLKYVGSDSGIDRYRRKETAAFYMFSKNDGILIYKIVIYPDKKWDKTMAALENKCGDAYYEGGTYFFDCGDDLGFKMSDLDEEIVPDAFQLWIGSIELWNDFAGSRAGMNDFLQ